MKAWGWISMRRSLGDALKNAFEEATIKNMPIDLFWSFKWRNKVQNWNLHEKLNKIGPFGNFEFWSKVNAKSQSQQSRVKVNGYMIQVGFGFLGWVTGRAAELLMSPYGVSLTWPRACVVWWRGMMMSPNDISMSSLVRGWHVMACIGAWWRDRYPTACMGMCEFVRSPDSQAK